MNTAPCNKCNRKMASLNKWYQCSACQAWFCPSCMDRYCLFCKGAVKEIPKS